MPKINPQYILAVIGILAVLFSLIKVFFPDINLKVTSCYCTLDENDKGLFILKLQTISNVDVMLEDVNVKTVLENGKVIPMFLIKLRLKGVCFKMLDFKKQERDYKLLKPLDSDLRVCGIKQGVNECYVCMESVEKFEDKNTKIKSWLFSLKYRQHLLPMPNLPWFNKKIITVIQPEEKDLYFDDLLFQKISPEEREKMLEDL